MSSIQKIKDKLAGYPEMRFTETPNSITVLPQDETGFEVCFTETGKEYVVSFKGWHEHLKDEKEALDCFAFGLFGDSRIKVVSYGDRTHSWTLQAKKDDQWVDRDETTLLFFPFWKKRKVEHFQNHHHLPMK